MIIANEHGPVEHAFLDASLIDPSCRGLRCRLTVGEKGGIVVDAIDGTRAVEQTALRSIATYAVLFTDPRDHQPLALIDGKGSPARVVIDTDCPADSVQMNEAIVRLPDAVLLGKCEQIPEDDLIRRLEIASTAIGVIIGIFGLAIVFGPDAIVDALGMTQDVAATFALALCSLGGLLFGVSYTRVQHRRMRTPQGMITGALDIAMERELERRSRIPLSMEATS